MTVGNHFQTTSRKYNCGDLFAAEAILQRAVEGLKELCGSVSRLR